MLGLSYKPDVDDLRESPSIELCHILQEKGVKAVSYTHLDVYKRQMVVPPGEHTARISSAGVLSRRSSIFAEPIMV